METKAPDKLKELLQRADAAADPPPELPADFALRLHHLALRKRHFRIGLGATAAAAAVVAAVGLTLLILSGPGDDRGPGDGKEIIKKMDVNQNDEIAAIRAEVARLEAEVASRLAVVRHMEALEAAYRRRDELRRRLARLDTAERIAREVDEVAFIIVYDADQQRKLQGGQASAIAAYRDVIRLFGQTRWAKVARDRLAEIEKS